MQRTLEQWFEKVKNSDAKTNLLNAAARQEILSKVKESLSEAIICIDWDDTGMDPIYFDRLHSKAVIIENKRELTINTSF